MYVKKIFGGILIIIILISGGLYWLMDSYQATDKARQLMETEETINFDQDNNWIIAQPQHSTTKGIIFYPGARVKPKAYIPLSHKLSQQGYLVVTAVMRFDLAIFGVDRANEIIEAFPQIDNWTIAGHSLGGAMAGRYLKNNQDKINNLILLASYIDDGDDLSEYENLKVLSVFGAQDEIVTKDDIEESKNYLPADTVFKEITGANHSQFGYYGFQNNDGQASISRSRQHELIVEKIVVFLN